MIPEEAKTSFLEFTAATTPSARELEEVTSFIQTYTSWTGMKKMLTQVSNTSWMFHTDHGGDKMLLMGSTTTHRSFHITGLPPSCEHGDSIGQTKDVMVYARGINHE